ncbi:MAG: hypothetical protein IJE10_04865 [Clostridia bacterium]|nr:hypothetical protein [Clostridia bacterium]
MRIHQDFVGGNISVVKTEGNTVYLKNQLRDTEGDWFYWAFCVEGAQGQPLTFQMEKNRVGYFGPAVSHDLKTWEWLNQVDGECFIYTFKEDEDKVYFAHNMLYHPSHFMEFCAKNQLKTEEFCKTKKGRSVPCYRFGAGEQTVLLTARHHACESTGNYVLEGVLEVLLNTPLPFKVVCVPFMDYDGVVDGDQGKQRMPHDHNRDYVPTNAPIYPETAEIRRIVAEEDVLFGFDFHSPWHKGGEHDNVYIVQGCLEAVDRYDTFAEIFEENITPDCLKYEAKNDLKPNTGWNKLGNHTFSSHVQAKGHMAFTLETTYFGTPDNRFTAERGREMGKAFGKSVLEYYAKFCK